MKNLHDSGLLITLKKQIEKLEHLIQNFSSIQNYRIYQKNPLANLFNTKSEKIKDFTLELNEDYQEIIKTKNEDINKYNIQKLGEKIEALFKYIKFIKVSLEKKKKSQHIKKQSEQNNQNPNNSINAKDQLYKQSLEHRKTWLLGMIKKIDAAIASKSKLLNDNPNLQNKDESNNIRAQLIKLKNKKQEIEKELFSITEQL